MSFTARELKLDYFQIYDVANRDATGDVLLQGQFDTKRLKMRLALLDFFANPTAKNAEPIYNKNAHLTWYRGVQPVEPMRAVVLENQYFAVPVTKRHDAKDFPIQNKTAHLLIIGITPRNIEKRVTLRNQFARGVTVPVVRSIALAVPSIKLRWK